ncbi:MAG: hypothetical protein A2V65_08560 [Deltaproteobacteria bacterium RBG_13_49_15]|nr:MAG: hypothetical protein A2V65_08560 [Deltaproteobacteria bacterium RBG_13_49_15]
MSPFLLRFNKTPSIAFRCLLQQKLRSILSIVGVICGVITVLIMLGTGEGAKRKILAQIERLGTRNIYIQSVTLNRDQTARAAELRSRGLRMTDGVYIQKSFPEAVRTAGLKEIKAGILGASMEFSPQIVASSESYDEILNLSIFSGRFLTRIDIEQQNLVCVLGNTVAKRLGAKGNPGQLIRIQNHLFRVVGVLTGLDPVSEEHSAIAIRNFNNMVFIPIGTEQFIDTSGIKSSSTGADHSFLNKNESVLDEMVIQMQRTDVVPHAAHLIQRIMDLLHYKADDFQIVVPLELLKQSQQTQRTLNILLAAIASVSLIVGGIGIMNIMLATVSERTREIGIRRAVGATRLDIITQFLIEAVILTFSGGIVGVLLGTAVVRFAAGVGEWHIVITFQALAIPLAMAVFVGIFFGLYPAYRAAKMNPVNAFRHE